MGCAHHWPQAELPAAIATLQRQADHPNIVTLIERLLLARPQVVWQPHQDEILPAVKWMLGNGAMPFHNDE
eukprot:5187044-Pyramimonas_sp.AAC.1